MSKKYEISTKLTVGKIRDLLAPFDADAAVCFVDIDGMLDPESIRIEEQACDAAPIKMETHIALGITNHQQGHPYSRAALYEYRYGALGIEIHKQIRQYVDLFKECK